MPGFRGAGEGRNAGTCGDAGTWGEDEARVLGLGCRRYPPLARQPKPQHAITVAVSSRALFDLVEERRIYEEQGVEKYVEYQQQNENVTLKPGPAFHFVKVRRQAREAGAEDAARPNFGKRRSPEPS